MNPDTVTRIIQVVIAPVVMITSCSILLGGMLSHYTAISDRLRAIARERLDLLRANAGGQSDSLTVERLNEFKVQVPQLLERLEMSRDAILAIYSAILVFVVDMFVIAAAEVTDAEWIATAALVVFLFGTGVMLSGIWITAREIRRSQRAVAAEALRGLELTR
jgi:hypothetical protein